MTAAAEKQQCVCACGRGYASSFDGRCGLCREKEIRRLQKKGRPYRHLLPQDKSADADLATLAPDHLSS